MVDLSQYLNMRAGEAKRPQPLKVGIYKGRVSRYEPGQNNRNNTPYIRIFVVPYEWPEGTTQDEIGDTDLSRRQLRKDFYLTEESLYRLDDFLRSCGIVPNGQTYGELMSQVISMDVTFEVTHFQPTGSDTVFDTINNIVGPEAQLPMAA